MTSQDIIKALKRRYKNDSRQTPRYVIAEEVRLGLGFAYMQAGNVARRLDCIVLDTYSDLAVIGFEIKVSRSDFLADLKLPEKHDQALRTVDKFFWICPEKLIQPHEIPPGMGLMWVSTKKVIRVKVASDWFSREKATISRTFAFSIMRRLYQRNEFNHE